MPRQKPLSYFLLFVSLAVYCFIAYAVQRHESTALFASYFLLFAIYVWTLKTARDEQIDFWVYGSILFRLSLLLAVPSLSDDFYRFIWDGRLLTSGIHPFAELPGFYLQGDLNIAGIDQSLYDHLNSKEYFTIYPPFAQFIFWISVIIFPKSLLGSVVIMRIFVLAAEVCSVVIVKKLLQRFNLDSKNVLVYALNPLVILELTGNLHFEAFVIFFIVLTLYFLVQSRILLAGLSFGLSIGAKLLPMIFLPLFLFRVGFKRSFIFYAAAALTCLLLFAPLLNEEILDGFGESFGLYFRRFEFNASIYYLVREYGFLTKGYNIIQAVGWKLGLIATIGILVVSLWPYTFELDRGKFRLKLTSFTFPEVIGKVPLMMMWVMLIYFLMTTTLHPWYITTILMLSVFTPFRFTVVWSALIFLTYVGYSVNGFSENLYLTTMEYMLVIGYLVYELIWQRRHSYHL